MARLDRTGKRHRWTLARSAESNYAAKLRTVARQIGVLQRGLAPGGSLENVGALVNALVQYADIVTPWAGAVSGLMLADVERRDKSMWRRNSAELGRSLRHQLENAPVGEALRDLQREQIELIRTIPLDAAERVQGLAQASITNSKRASVIAAELMESEGVSRSKANTIARTEVSRAASNLVEARAVAAGSEGYIWRTVGDFDVRHSHAQMEGKYVRWAQPPTLDKMTGHAGTLPNCRCFAEPIFPDF